MMAVRITGERSMAKHEIQFTKAAIESLPLPEKGKQAAYYDSKSRGLCVIISNSGVKSYYVLRKFKGKPERKLIGRFPDTTVSMARQRAGEINALFDSGLNPNDVVRRERGELTLDQLQERYMAIQARPRNRRPEKQAYHYRLYLSHWGNRKLSDISKIDVQLLHGKIAEERGKRSANVAITHLRALYNRAIDWDLFSGPNPTQGTRKFKTPARDRFLLPDELHRFLEALRSESADMRDFFLLLLLTGVRKGNLLTMHWNDVDLVDAVWRIPETKSGDPQVLPLSKYAVQVLMRRRAIRPPGPNSEEPQPENPAGTSGPPSDGIRRNGIRILDNMPGNPENRFRTESRHRSECNPVEIRNKISVSEWVFPGTGISGHLKDPKRAWKKLLSRAGISDFRMHDLRRTHASYMAASGANHFIIGRALGHKDIGSTAIYARLDLDPIRFAATQATEQMLANTPGLPFFDEAIAN